MRKKIVFLFIISFWAIGLINAENPVVSVKQNKKPSIEKIKDIVIYKDSMFYVAFPSVTKNAEGEYIVAFRRAPDRKATMGYKGRYHSDPNSYLVMLRSKDGENWGTEPDLLFAHPQGGSQDPCLLTLRDGTMLCSSYCWTFILQEAYAKLKQPVKIAIDGGVFLGGYMVRSEDNGKTWKGPYYPPSLTEYNNVLGQPLPAANRGAFCEGKSGRIFWSVNKARVGKPSQNYLLYSDDKGISWEKSCMVASDDKVTFNETSIYETPKGDLVAFLRTANNDDHPCIARSTDGGKSFSQWEEMGFQGHPLHALRLSDNRVLLVYGYRHEPYGIRAKILNPECTDFKEAPEFVIRDDGGNHDLGYPWSVQLDDNRVLVVYYFQYKNDTRFIGGSILKID